MNEYYELMRMINIVSEDWKHPLKLVTSELSLDESLNADQREGLKVLFATYFSLIDDGNAYMSLDAAALEKKFTGKLSTKKVEVQEEEGKVEIFDEVEKKFKDALKYISLISGLNIIGDDRLFIIDNDRLFLRKYCYAKEIILAKQGELFVPGTIATAKYDYKKFIKPDFNLSTHQQEVVDKGYYNNLLVTGGPGTGKTTSIFFLLLPLLMENPDYDVYLAAPSGKAASRMKESVINNKNFIDGNASLDAPTKDALDTALAKIESLEDYTIHRLLGPDAVNGGFKRNKKNQFKSESIFVIDEASMIDIELFASLLEAIPQGARVFILGDKDQLPAVEIGAVYAELLGRVGADNKVYIKESQRFSAASNIYVLAEAINTDGQLPVAEEDWKQANEFEIVSEYEKSENPIYYYNDDAAVYNFGTRTKNEAAMIESVTSKWYRAFYEPLKDLCKGIKKEDNEEQLKEIFEKLDDAKILCACNKGARGVQTINKMLLKKYFNINDRVSGYYPGELLMVTENMKQLDLYNGDSGVAVTFDSDENIYIVFKKKSSLNIDIEYTENRMFSIGDYVFYPARLIGREYITLAFAITIHKSQGSDYNNVLTILPRMEGHPLLNRQIVYTAITRTKGATYILSNQGNMEYAKGNVIVRETM